MNDWHKRGRCWKCGEYNEKLCRYNNMLLDDKCLIDEKDKFTHQGKVDKLETYRKLVLGTKGVTDDIDEA
jgi:hypothetical protein